MHIEAFISFRCVQETLWIRNELVLLRNTNRCYARAVISHHRSWLSRESMERPPGCFCSVAPTAPASTTAWQHAAPAPSQPGQIAQQVSYSPSTGGAPEVAQRDDHNVAYLLTSSKFFNISQSNQWLLQLFRVLQRVGNASLVWLAIGLCVLFTVHKGFHFIFAVLHELYLLTR